MATAAAAAAAAAAVAARRINNDKINRRSSGLSSSSFDGFYRNDVFLSTVTPTPVAIITITCLESGKRDVDAVGRLLVVPSSFEELKHVGMQIYGATFYRVLLENGAEIDDIRVVRNGDVIVFAEETMAWDTITITCLEKGDVAGKLLVVPRTFEELKQVGVKVYGAHYVRVLDEEGNEINDVRVLRNGDRIVYASQKRAEESNARAMIMLTITCLEKGDSVGRLLVLRRGLGEVRRVGEKIYGAHFVRVLNEEGNEINAMGMLRDGVRVDYAASRKWAKESDAWITVTITCLEMGDFAGKLLVLPCSLMELKVIGVKIYGAIFLGVTNEKGVEINDIRVLRNGDRVIFGREKWKSNVQKWAKELNAHKRVEELNAQKRAKELNAHKRAKESNAQKWVEESNAPVKITCLAPIMRVLRKLW
ncbi:hypothetical protein AAHA92_16071 [Salvia divinorum]|uniref:Uncharacterized protein n=1 Tax=Salvia divinorum TaxID=28513 RepID=A0ABD1GUC5_SALDI